MGTHTVVAYKERIRRKGKPATVDAVSINGQCFLVSGKFLRIAELKDRWAEDVDDPLAVSRALRDAPGRIDILKFWQRLPESKIQYSYRHEWRYLAVIPITTHQHWFAKQITKSARNHIKKATRQGVEVREEPLTDRLVEDIMRIYSESPVRRGKPFWHYGKDFQTVRAELSDDLDRSVFATAYYEGELIGFIKFYFVDHYARTSLILDKMAHRDKSPMNILFSKVVEICADRGTPYLVYSLWRPGSYAEFQKSNGFVKEAIPEYWVPLTLRGRLALFLNLYQGAKGWVPEKMMTPLLNLRAKWYGKKFRAKAFRSK